MNRRMIAWLVLLAACFSAPQTQAAVYSFSNIVDTTTAAPLGTFGNFGRPAISGSRVAFLSSYSGGGGIFTGFGGPLTTIAKMGDAAPVGEFFGLLPPAISGDTVVFLGFYAGQRSGIFVGNGGPLTTIAKTLDNAPIGTFNFFGEPAISADTVAFNYNVSNIVTNEGGITTIVAKRGDAAPIGQFGFLSNAAISGGTVGFHGHYQDATSGDQGTGVFARNAGLLTTIAKSGDATPSGVFERFGEPSISGRNLAFAGTYDDQQTGIFVGDGGPLTTIALVGQSAPVGEFEDFDDPSISGSEVAFLARYGNQGTDDQKYGIFLGNGGPLRSVIKVGDPLFSSVVTSVDFGRFGLDPSGSGNIAFRYSLANGKTGVAVATLVPEPCALALAGLAMASAGVMMRGWRRRGGD